jgi:uncharacterized membrane protein
MFSKLQHTVALAAGKSVLNSTDDIKLSTGKRMISILAGAFIFRRGLKNITKSPIVALQEIALGGLLLYNGATGENHLNFKANQHVRKGAYGSIPSRNPMPQLVRIK